MGPEQLRQLLRRQPFVAIRLFMSDGTTYDVKHPEMAFVTRSTVEVGTEKETGSGIAEKVVYCSLGHIVRVEDVDGRAAAAHARQ